MTDTILLAGLTVFSVILLLFVFRNIVRGINIFATPPVHPLVFISAKVSAAISLLFIPLGILAPGIRWHVTYSPVAWMALLLFSCGAVIAVIAMKRLGDDLIFGLPSGGIRKLQTEGIYALSRNPLYFGFIMIIISSWLSLPHPLNFIAGATAIALHHMIVLSEEQFLLTTHGEEYKAYMRKTSRYFII